MDSTYWQKMLLHLENSLPQVLRFALSVLFAIVVYLVGTKIIKQVGKVMRRSMEKANVDVGVAQFVTSITKTTLLLLLVLNIAFRFGLKESAVAALVASSGVAVGLALQGGLSNLAGGVLILLVKPFQVGDYIIENKEKQEGTVTKIEMFYTTLSTVDNRRITVPNGSITASSIVNVTSQDKRKLEIKVNISYRADLKKAKSLLEELLHKDPCILSEEDMKVFVDSLGESAVVLGFRAWVKTEEYWDTKWRLNEEIKLTFDEQGIELPYPQLDVHFHESR